MGKFLKYLSFRGRANRQRFWLTALAIIGLYLAMIALVAIARIVPLLALIPLAGVVVLVIANLANAARRLHDRNKSAWWLLLFQGAPMVLSTLGFAISMGARGSPGGVGLSGFITLIELPIGIWAFVELGCLPGTKGVNKYGDDPLGAPVVEAFA